MPPAEPRPANPMARAAGRYVRSARQGTSPCRVDGDLPAQTENLCRALERQALRAEQVRRVLARTAVPPAQFLAYRNYGLHLDKLCRTHSGATLRHLARAAMDYWTAYGLDPVVLGRIGKDVFNIDCAADHLPARTVRRTSVHPEG